MRACRLSILALLLSIEPCACYTSPRQSTRIHVPKCFLTPLSQSSVAFPKRNRQHNPNPNKMKPSQKSEEPSTALINIISTIQSDLHFCGSDKALAKESLQKCSRLMEIPSSKLELSDRLKILLQIVPIKTMKRMVLKHPNLFYSILLSTNITPPHNIFRDDLHLSPSEIKKLHTKFPVIFNRLYSSDLRRKISFLTFQAGLSKPQLRKVIVKRPQVLAYTVSKYNRTLTYFQSDVGLTNEEVSKMIFAEPLILTHSIDNKFRPMVDFLKTDAGCSEEQIRKILYKYPQMASHSVTNKLKPKILFLSRALGLERRSDVSRIVSLFPPTLWLTEENTIAKFDFLKKELDLNTEELRCVILTMPQLIGLSIQNNLQPTIQFLLQSMDQKKLKEFVLYQPALLAYSLEKRIIPRITRMNENDISFEYAPSYVMSYPNEKFDQWLDMHDQSWSTTDAFDLE